MGPLHSVSSYCIHRYIYIYYISSNPVRSTAFFALFRCISRAYALFVLHTLDWPISGIVSSIAFCWRVSITRWNRGKIAPKNWINAILKGKKNACSCQRIFEWRFCVKCPRCSCELADERTKLAICKTFDSTMLRENRDWRGNSSLLVSFSSSRSIDWNQIEIQCVCATKRWTFDAISSGSDESLITRSHQMWWTNHDFHSLRQWQPSAKLCTRQNDDDYS